MVILAEHVVAENTLLGHRTKRPEYDLPRARGDKLELPPLVVGTPAFLENHQPTVVDLFCGAGGMSLGFESAGFRTVLGVDCDHWASQTFAAHIPAKGIVQDLNSITNFRAFFTEYGVHQVTGIIGGPPCQGFSRVGRGRIRHRDRLKGHTELQPDSRNHLYRQYLAAVEALRPLFFVMENVPDLDHYEDDDGLLADHIQAEFERLDYVVDRRILLASDFGVPQNRSRLFFVGFHQSLGKTFCWPDHKAARKLYGVQSLRAAIGDLPIVADGHLARCIPYEVTSESWLHRWYRGGMQEGQEHLLFDHLTRPHREDDKKVFRGMQEGQVVVR
ncbi:MAG: DNA cytosine methyltransferase [Chloroflexota bacterium]|nr:DNA cytosine methyltransferase [Chloroflexota bacterium]